MAGSTKMVEDGTDLLASSPASSAELFKAIAAAMALCTAVALRINKRHKKLHVEHEYGAEVAKEFDAVDPLGEKGSADNKELKKSIEKVKANKPSSSSSRAKPASSSRKPESFRRGSDNRRESGRREEKSPTAPLPGATGMDDDDFWADEENSEPGGGLADRAVRGNASTEDSDKEDEDEDEDEDGGNED
eukprot:jgi/Tetstr1/464682/TSEL_009434.t1